jgi:hypothetical protein
MSLINQQSFIFFAVLVLGLVAFFLLRDGPRRRDFAILAFLMLGIAGLWYLLRPTASAGYAAADQVRAQIGAGTPVLLEFQSPT